MIIDLTGKRAIVTGSTSGIEFAIARGLAETGAAVVLNGRTQKSVDGAIKRLAQQVPRAKVEGVAAAHGQSLRLSPGEIGKEGSR